MSKASDGKVEWEEVSSGLLWQLWVGGSGPFAWVRKRRNDFAWIVGVNVLVRGGKAAATLKAAKAACERAVVRAVLNP